MPIDPFVAHERALEDLMLSLGDACPKIGWNSGVFRAIPSGARQASNNSPGGFSLDFGLTLTLLVADFNQGEFPDSTEVFTYPAGADSYKIISTTVMAGGRTFRIHGESASQGQ